MTGLLLGAVFGFGVILVFDGLTASRGRGAGGRGANLAGLLPKALLAAAAGAGALALTGWPVAALAGACAGFALPGWVGERRASRERAGRREAIAEASERLRDAVRAGAGVAEGIGSLAAHGPTGLRPAFRQAQVELRLGGVPAALEGLQVRLDDPLGDLLVGALRAADRTGGKNLSAVLEDLAATARRQATTLREIRARQARNLLTARVVAGAPLALLLAIGWVNPGYLAPYRSAAGQLVLALVLAMVGAGYLVMVRTARLPAELGSRRRG